MDYVESDACDILFGDLWEKYDEKFGIDYGYVCGIKLSDRDDKYGENYGIEPVNDGAYCLVSECQDNGGAEAKLENRFCEFCRRSEPAIQFAKFITSAAVVGLYYYVSGMMTVGCVLTLVEILARIVQCATLHQARYDCCTADQCKLQSQVSPEAAAVVNDVERAFSIGNAVSSLQATVVYVIEALLNHDLGQVGRVLKDIGLKLMLSAGYEECLKEFDKISDDNNEKTITNLIKYNFNLVFCVLSGVCTSVVFGDNALFHASFQWAIGYMMKSVDNATDWMMDYQV